MGFERGNGGGCLTSQKPLSALADRTTGCQDVLYGILRSMRLSSGVDGLAPYLCLFPRVRKWSARDLKGFGMALLQSLIGYCSSESWLTLASVLTMSSFSLETPLNMGKISAAGSQQDKVRFQFPSIGSLQILCRSIHAKSTQQGQPGRAGSSCDWSFLAVVS